MTVSYDAVGNLKTLKYPTGEVVTYSYDEANQLVEVLDYAGRVTKYAYNKNGQLEKTTRPDGSVETVVYDKIGRMTAKKDVSKGITINSYTYEYDGNGNIVTENNLAEDTTKEYTYEAVDTMPALTKMTYGNGNKLESYNGTELKYDADGNMTYGPLKGEFATYEYDEFNRLVQGGGTSYAYDGENNRISQTTNGKKITYITDPNANLSRLLMTVNPDGSKTLYTYGIGLISQEEIKGADKQNYKLFHYDYRGSTTALTDVSGIITDLVMYDPYGAVIARSGVTNTVFLYVGQTGVQTDDNGLQYMRGRYYNSDIKRFINSDPVKDGLNWYTYVNGNPISFIDANGYWPTWGQIGTAVGIAAVTAIVVLGLVVIAAPAAGFAAGVTAFNVAGLGATTAASIATTGGTTLAYGLAATTATLGANRAVEALTGNNYIGNAIGEEALSNIEFLNSWGAVGAMGLGETFYSTLKPMGNTKVLCFTADTQVKVSTGHKEIKDIAVGDEVYSENTETGETGYKKVKQIFINETYRLMHIKVDGLVIKATEQHPFYVVDKGWIEAKDLEIGDCLKSADGSVKQIESLEIEDLENPIKVYNFEVEDWHTYHVSDSDILVHNDCSQGSGNIFSNDKMLESTFITKEGMQLGALADVQISGKTLTLKDIALYSTQGDIKNAVGIKQLSEWIKLITLQAKNQGFEKLIIKGIRATNSTSANPGSEWVKIIDLTK